MNQMEYKAYSDSYLMSLTKAEIIELLRVAEHNFFTTEEALNNSVKAGMEIAEKFDKAKELLKMAMAVLNDGSSIKKCEDCNTSCTRSCKFKWKFTDEVERLFKML